VHATVLGGHAHTNPGRVRSLSVAFVLLIAGMGLVDSLNPATIAVGVVLGTTERPLLRLSGYAAGIFAVYFVGGLVLTLGPSELIRTATSHPEGIGFDIALVVVGLVAFGFAAWVFVHRRDAAKVPDVKMRPGSALALGAGMTAVDLPTAFPYFAAVVAIIGEDLAAPVEIALLVLFNVMYIAPIVLIAVVAVALGERAERPLLRIRAFVTRWSPVLLVVLSVAVGVVALVSGVKGLVS
jgi:cytochrome c biogenesis protein CcdA